MKTTQTYGLAVLKATTALVMGLSSAQSIAEPSDGKLTSTKSSEKIEWIEQIEGQDLAATQRSYHRHRHNHNHNHNHHHHHGTIAAPAPRNPYQVGSLESPLDC